MVVAMTIAGASNSAVQGRDDQPMPRALLGRFDSRRPAYLDASEVIDQNGQLRRDAPLSTAAERNLRDFLGAPKTNGCVHVGEVYYDWVNGPRRTSLAGTIQQSDFVVETRVVNRSYGFLDGVPGQLLRLNRVSTLKGTAPDYASYYIFVPVADFVVGGIHSCKTDIRYGAAPAVGDTVFVMSNDVYVSNDYIDTVDEAGYVRALPDGRLVLPKSLAASSDVVTTATDLRRLAY